MAGSISKRFWSLATLLVRLDMATAIGIAATMYLWMTWR
jgi:hypothetical protein